MKLQMVGDMQKLKLEPKNTLPDNRSKPSSSQMLGTTVPIQSNATTVKFGAGTPNGTVQMDIASKVKMSDKPFSGWQSYDTPPSDRTIQQKKSI